MIEFEIDGRRQASLEQGLQALSVRLGSISGVITPIAKTELRVFLNKVTRRLTNRHSTRWSPNRTLPSGDARGQLAKRSGELLREIRSGTTVIQAGADTIIAELRVPGLHEEGYTVRPRSRRYLAIPLPAALDSRGLPRRPGPRSWENTFVLESKRGNLLIMQRKGRNLTPLYVLKTEVRVPPRLGARHSFLQELPAFERSLLTRVSRVLDSI